MTDKESFVFMIKSIFEKNELTNEISFIDVIVPKFNSKVASLNDDIDVNKIDSRKIMHAENTILNDKN